MIVKTYFLCIPLIWIVMFTGCTAYKDTSRQRVMQIRWQVLDRNVEGSEKTQAKMILTNVSTDVLTGAGWAIYFNAGDIQVLESDRYMVRIDAVNGDVFKLSPEANWRDLPPDSSCAITVVCRMVKNFTDLPKGFYLVSEKYPDGVDISFTAEPPAEVDSLEWDLALQQYTQNELVADVPVDAIPPIFPSPKQYVYNNSHFVLNAACTITAEDEFANEAAFLQAELKRMMEAVPALSNQQATKQIIFRKKDITHREGYELTIDDTQIRIEASTATGAFHAVQSLMNMVP